MSDKKPKIIKKRTLEEIELREYEDRVSLARNLFRWLKLKKPEKAKELLKELQTECA